MSHKRTSFFRVGSLLLAAAFGLSPTHAATPDETVWGYVESMGTVESFAAYLEANPNGEFADLAIAQLQAFAEQGVIRSRGQIRRSGIFEVLIAFRNGQIAPQDLGQAMRDIAGYAG